MASKIYICKNCGSKWKYGCMLSEEGLCVNCAIAFFEKYGWKRDNRKDIFW